MIPNSILVMNGKGGVGKTSLVANLAANAAAGGWKVLAVDTDPQGNLARDLGVLAPSDAGRNLREAGLAMELLEPMRDVRPNLDVAPGGEELHGLLGNIQACFSRGQFLSATAVIERAIAPIAASYDLVVMDSPPGEKALQTAAARAARFILIPTCPDECSIDGLGVVFDHYHQLRHEGTNPQLGVLGVVLALVPVAGTAIARRARATLHELLGGQVPVFAQTVRFAQTAAVDCRRLGLTASEYAARACTAEPWYRDRASERCSTAAAGLAADYELLTAQILRRYALAVEADNARDCVGSW